MITRRWYIFLFSLLGIVYISGLWFPLPDNDAAHHANIALRMLITGDYLSLVDQNGDYIDKPHFLFWISAASFKIFGVNAFAYRFPSLLFTIAGTWSLYQLAAILYNKEVGRLAALIAASTICYLLANSDVRMDAILTASVVFSTWQLVLFLKTQSFAAAMLAGLGLGIGFITKGHVGIAVPAIGILGYLSYSGNWKRLASLKVLLIPVVFLIIISPVLYAFYVQFDLHPEKIVHGKTKVSGVRYILWDHSFDRFSGHERFGWERSGRGDYFFYFHTFLWTFTPWCLLFILALIRRFRKLRSYEWLTLSSFLVLSLLIIFSSFKLPHYFTILVPFVSIIVSVYVLEQLNNTRLIYGIQVFVSITVLLAAAAINGWAFPVESIIIILVTIFLLSVFFYSLITQRLDRFQKSIVVPVLSIIILFFLLYNNFYPRLLTYQAGKPMARLSKKIISADSVYFSPNTFSSSFDFYSQSLRKTYSDSLLMSKERAYIIYDKSEGARLDSSGIEVEELLVLPDFEITKLSMRFINPSTRDSTLNQMVFGRTIQSKNQ